MATNLICRVHPVVLFNIVDSYERRNEDARRVIGTLLGTTEKGAVEITNCFAVPHNESDDEVAIDLEYARNMNDLHRKVHPNELVLGWYSTGPEVTEHSVLIHEYYGRECKNPVHLTVDTSLKNARMGIKTYISSSLGVPEKTVGTLFTPIPVEVKCYEPERVGLDVIQMGKHNPKRQVHMTSDLQRVVATCAKLKDMLGVILKYVDEVISEEKPADPKTGRYLMDLVNSVPKIDPEQFEEMLNSNMKDLLMVVYLSNLVKSQLTINEKLFAMDGVGR